MIEIFIKIRSIITFIEEETSRVGGSDEVKKDIIIICKNVSDALEDIGEVENLELVANIKKELEGFDTIVEKIKDDEINLTLFLLLVTHVSDIRFLFLTKVEQEKMLLELNKK